MTDLVLLLKDRPAILKKDGVSFYVSVHDAGFLREVKRLFEEVCFRHPDNPIEGDRGTGQSFRGPRRPVVWKRKRTESHFNRATTALGCFLARERDTYYKPLGLLPPQWDRWKRWADERDGTKNLGIPSRAHVMDICQALLEVNHVVDTE